MTTLPQTTPLRLPRPGNGQMTIPQQGPGGAAPHAPMGLGQGGATGGPQMTAGDVWRVIRGHLWLIVACVVVAGVGGFALNKYLQKYHARYTASGYLQIKPVFNPDPLNLTPPVVESQTLVIEQRTNVQMLRSESLISRVFDSPEQARKVRETQWFAAYNGDVQQAKKDLLEDFSASPVPESKLIAISFSCGNPQDARNVTDALGQTHIDMQTRASRDDQQKRSVVLKNTLDQLERLQNERRASANQRMGVLNTSGFGTQGRLSPKEEQLSELVKQQLAIDLTLSQAAAQMNAAARAEQRGDVPAKVSDIVEKDMEIITLQARVNEAEIQANQAISGLAEEHWRVKELQAGVRAQQQQLDRRRNEKVAAEQVRYLEALRTESQALAENSKSVGARIDALKQEMADLANQMALYLTEKDEEAYYKEKAKAIEEQLRLIAQMDLQQGVNNVNWAPGGQPLTPELPTFPKLPVTMALSLFAGLALSLGIAFLRELTDTSIRSPRDVARVGQLALLGSVPDAGDDPMAAGARLPLVIFDAPTSMTADQFRQIRTRLQYAASLDTTRSILVTSPGPNDGKTAVACNLAAGLALNGRRILLVDADFRRPDVHKVFEVANDRGFSDALQNPEALEDLILQTQVPNLSVLPTGPRPANATELLESQLLTDFIERALEEYDHVIFDSGSLMVVSEAIALAPRVDGVITVCRARQNSRGLLARMRDTLRQLKAEHLGVILNGVQAQGGGYYARNIKEYYAYQATDAA